MRTLLVAVVVVPVSLSAQAPSPAVEAWQKQNAAALPAYEADRTKERAKVEKNVDYNAIFQTIKERFPKTTFIQAWNGGFGYQNHRNIDKMMSDPWMITRDELDWHRVCASR